MRSSTEVRSALAIALLVLTTSLTACGGRAPTSHGLTTVSKAAVPATPSGFVVQPDISDPLCNGGRGIRLAAQRRGDAVVASGLMADGSTLIALSSIYPGKRFAALHSVTRACAPNREFGDDGAATITISSRLQPANPATAGLPTDGLWISAVVARNGGGAIVAGTYEGNWVVGEITRRGKVDPAFGKGGWAVLPFGGEVTAVLQEPSGRIVIGGDNGGGGCCTLNWAAAVSARGQLERGFGRHGREELPTGEDSGVEALALEPGGDILAKVGYGNMGCWGVALAMLKPSGRPVPLFANRLSRFWHGLGFGAFVGDAHIDGEGFTLVGTGQRPCADGPSFSAPSARGVITSFRTDGKPVSPAARFPSRMYGDVRAFEDGDDTLVVESPYADPTQLTLTARRLDGSIDPRFGSGGRARIHTPWRGFSATLDTTVSISNAGAGAIVIVAARSDELQVIRVRL
jgi:hypothetical protein